MIGIDSNVLMRVVLGDDKIWSARAEKLIAAKCTSAQPGYINTIVLAEAFWLLRRRPDFDKQKLVEFVRGLLDSEIFVVADERTVLLALKDYVSGNAGFADYLIARLNEAAGASPTYTIDKVAARNPIFQPVPY